MSPIKKHWGSLLTPNGRPIGESVTANRSGDCHITGGGAATAADVFLRVYNFSLFWHDGIGQQKLQRFIGFRIHTIF